MLLSQRPLTASDPDQQLMLRSRASLAEDIGGIVARGRNLLVIGERGSGRTTLLNALSANPGHRHASQIYRIDAGPWDDARNLAGAISAALGHDPRRKIGPVEALLNPIAALEARQDPGILSEIDIRGIVRAARDVQKNAESRYPIAFLLDNLHGDAAHDLFGRFRDSLWPAPIVWVAAVDESDRAYLTAPADAFWEKVIHLPRLDKNEAEQLLRLRVEAAPEGDLDASPRGSSRRRSWCCAPKSMARTVAPT